MIYNIFKEKDNFILSQWTSPDRRQQNCGLDEILEIQKIIIPGIVTSSNYYSRILIKFDMDLIPEECWLSENSKYYLNLYSTQPENLPIEYNIYCYPISESWEMGNGFFNDSPITEKYSNWWYRNDSEKWITSSWANYSTGSFSEEAKGGGTWYTSSVITQSFVYKSRDINMDVTEIINAWSSSEYSNDGFILRRNSIDEQSTSSLGTLKYFSKDTGTIYQPRIECCWDDSSWETGSLTALQSDNIIVYINVLKVEYSINDKIKFRILGREKYPTRTYVTASSNLTINYLPTSSYYSLIDAHTDEVIIPFSDDYTKLSCDSTSNYFYFWMDQLEPQRYYKFVFKIKTENTEEYFDGKYIFKVNE